jgi:hypothetical protein
LSDSAASARLPAALGAQVAAGAPGALARIDAPPAGLDWAGSADQLERGRSRPLRPEVAPESGLRYDRYGLGMGLNVIEGVELLGHTGFVGAFAFYAPGYDAVLAGTHHAFNVARWPLVAALYPELRAA